MWNIGKRSKKYWWNHAIFVAKILPNVIPCFFGLYLWKEFIVGRSNNIHDPSQLVDVCKFLIYLSSLIHESYDQIQGRDIFQWWAQRECSRPTKCPLFECSASNWAWFLGRDTIELQRSRSFRSLSVGPNQSQESRNSQSHQVTARLLFY